MKQSHKIRYLRKELNEFLFSIGVLAFFIFMFIQTYYVTGALSVTRDNVIFNWANVPRGFVAIGIAMAIGLIMQSGPPLFRKYLEMPADVPPFSDEEIAELKKERVGFLRVILSVANLTIFIALIPLLGVIIGGWIYIAAQIYIMMPQEQHGPKSYITMAIIALVTPVAAYFAFRYLFSMMFPVGILRGFWIF